MSVEEGKTLSAEKSLQDLEDDVVAILKTVYDPEIPVDIYELGLVYNVDVREDRSVEVRMTLTTPMCPVAEILPAEVESKIASVEGVASAAIDLVWEPPWNPGMMSEAAKLELGML
jgi:FeS assembly SUF system protein